jgi:hypothetical protein
MFLLIPLNEKQFLQIYYKTGAERLSSRYGSGAGHFRYIKYRTDAIGSILPIFSICAILSTELHVSQVAMKKEHT